MNITIVGAGALGTILGAHLVAAGHTVTVLARGARAADVAERGLRVSGLVELATPCRVLTEPGAVGDTDVLIYAVKTYHMHDAVASLAGSRPDAVFSLANGVMKNEQLVAAHGSEQVLGCMANFSGELLDSGTAVFTRNVRLAIGAARSNPGPTAEAIAAAIDAAGIRTDAAPDIETVEWSKFTGWVALFSLSLIARTTTGAYLENPQFARIGAELIRETARIAQARGIPLVDQSPVPVQSVASGTLAEGVRSLREVGAALAASAPGHRMSSLQDLEAGRQLEVEETLGYAANEAMRLGLEAPTLGLCYRLAGGLNAMRSGA